MTTPQETPQQTASPDSSLLSETNPDHMGIVTCAAKRALLQVALPEMPLPAPPEDAVEMAGYFVTQSLPQIYLYDPKNERIIREVVDGLMKTGYRERILNEIIARGRHSV